jgi:hypothetical protein
LRTTSSCGRGSHCCAMYGTRGCTLVVSGNSAHGGVFTRAAPTPAPTNLGDTNPPTRAPTTFAPTRGPNFADPTGEAAPTAIPRGHCRVLCHYRIVGCRVRPSLMCKWGTPRRVSVTCPPSLAAPLLLRDPRAVRCTYSVGPSRADDGSTCAAVCDGSTRHYVRRGNWEVLRQYDTAVGGGRVLVRYS